jgi:glycosyltransferase involved in cell wall biosynthesis
VTGPGPLISVCTPTYNRAATLPRLHESLCAQTFQDFEWLVVDDGSTDDTAEVIAALAAASTFPVIYLHQENAGKHVALNRATESCNGTFVAILDSDDWYLPICLERLTYHWNRLLDPGRYAEVQGLCADEHGTILGDRYPSDVFDSDYYTMTNVHRLRGDRNGMIRADVLRQHPFPETFEARYVPEAIVLNRIARNYLIRGFNEVIAHKEYRPDGLTHGHARFHSETAGPRLLQLEELLAMAKTRPLPPDARLKGYANLSRYSFHERRGLRKQARRAPSPPLWLATLPLGAALYIRDRLAPDVRKRGPRGYTPRYTSKRHKEEPWG